eukprot:6174410-Pleurochrysis_carterae.AAC.9
MAEPTGVHAGAILFSPPTILLSLRRGPREVEAEPEAGGRTAVGGKAPRSGAVGVASGPPTRPSPSLGEMGALSFAERTHHRQPEGRRGHRWPSGLEAWPNLTGQCA